MVGGDKKISKDEFNAFKGLKAPKPGKVFISVRDADKPRVLDVARLLIERGFSLVATGGTALALLAIPLTPVRAERLAARPTVQHVGGG